MHMFDISIYIRISRDALCYISALNINQTAITTETNYFVRGRRGVRATSVELSASFCTHIQ